MAASGLPLISSHAWSFQAHPERAVGRILSKSFGNTRELGGFKSCSDRLHRRRRAKHLDKGTSRVIVPSMAATIAGHHSLLFNSPSKSSKEGLPLITSLSFPFGARCRRPLKAVRALSWSGSLRTDGFLRKRGQRFGKLSGCSGVVVRCQAAKDGKAVYPFDSDWNFSFVLPFRGFECRLAFGLRHAWDVLLIKIVYQ